MRVVLSFAVVLMPLVLVSGIFPQGAFAKKYIAWGWEFEKMTPNDFLNHVEQFTATPLDGVGINVPSMDVISKTLWTRDRLEYLISPIRAMAGYKCFKESFIRAYCCPRKRLSWTDDDAWAIVSNNIRCVTWLAHEGGLPGISWDIEDYYKQNQFLRVEGEPSLNELQGIVRRRAQDVFRGVFEEYPSVTLFFFWLFSDAPCRYVEVDLPAMMRERADLWPAFVNGMLDVMPKTAVVVDGTENAYKFEASRCDFHTASVRTFNWDVPLVEPENRTKYFSQVSLSFGQYLDMYINSESADWYFGPVDGSRLRHLQINLEQATSVAQRYVWFWGERGSWIKWNDAVCDTGRIHPALKGEWSTLIPGGFLQTIEAVKDPDGYLLPRLKRAISNGTLKDVMDIGGFKPWKNPLPKGQKGSVPGLLSKQGTELRGVGLVGGGCFHQTLKGIREGDVYLICGSVRGNHLVPHVQYTDRNGRAMFSPRDYLLPHAVAGSDWRAISTFVVVPKDAAEMTVQFGFGKMDPNEMSVYRDVHIYRITDFNGWKDQ